jgi:hypothetical protein
VSGGQHGGDGGWKSTVGDKDRTDKSVECVV